MKVQPSYGLWARHVTGLTVKQSSFNYEKKDSRYVFFLEDVRGGGISSVKMVVSKENGKPIRRKNSTGASITNAVYYNDVWGNEPAVLPPVKNGVGLVQ